VNVGDVCREVAALPDVDGDGTADTAVCAENGTVAILSGASGRRAEVLAK